jgi:hypothetical protein
MDSPASPKSEAEVVPTKGPIDPVQCPICPAGPMTFGTRLSDISVLVCRGCGTTLTVPHSRRPPD